jgi:type I restriction enzyme R subunit
MDVSPNFAFLEQEFFHAAESATFAERLVYLDPRAACFRARHALESLVKRVYRVDKALSPPKTQNLDGYLSEPSFREVVPEAVWQKAELIRRAGNVAVHGKKMPSPDEALAVVHELYHVLYWAGRTYLRKGAESLQGKTYDASLVPKAEPTPSPASIEELEALKAERDAAAEAQQELEGELETLREQIAAIKAENEAVPDTHDWNEDKTRKLLIDLALRRAGWALDGPHDQEYKVTGMPNEQGFGFADYVPFLESGSERVAALFTDDGILATAGDLLAGADLDSLRVGSEEFRSLAIRHRGADMKVLGTPIMVERYGFQTAVFAGQWGDAIKFTVMLHLQDGKIALHIIDLAGPLEIPES